MPQVPRASTAIFKPLSVCDHPTTKKIVKGKILNISRSIKSLCLVTLAMSNVAFADNETDLKALLDANTYSVALKDGALIGPGADLLFAAAEGTQFVALGEEHYNFHIPAISTAIFSELHSRYAYQYFMTEQDPVTMEVFSTAPVRGDAEKIGALAAEYPMGVTFNSKQELKMLADIGMVSDIDDVIWGCDQASGVTHILDQLLNEDLNESALEAVRVARKTSAQKEAVRDYEKGHYIFDADTRDFEQLRIDVGAESGSRAEWLLDVLINSSRIFGFYKNGNNDVLPGYYENNRFREEHLKDLCLAKYRAAEAAAPMPRALMKFGSWHLYEGLSPTRIHAIGDFFSNVARFNGQEFLSIHFTSRPDDPEEAMSEIGFIWPFVRDLDPGEFAVIDLRPFRSYPNRVLVEKTSGDEWLETHKESYRRLVYGYDLIFFVGSTKEATFFDN